MYTNHRPAFGLQADKVAMAFELLGFNTDAGMAIDRGDLLDFLQSKGVTFKITYPKINNKRRKVFGRSKKKSVG